MQFIKKNQRSIAGMVLLAFLSILQVGSVSLRAEATGKIGKSTAGDDDTQPGMLEKESKGGTVAKKRSLLPYLLIGAGLAAGAAIYFLVIHKPKYSLTVQLGEGIDGVPAAGTYTYKKGDQVSYNYALATGYSNLLVTIDGIAAASSGMIEMKQNHVLTASTTKLMKLTVSGVNLNYVEGYPLNGTYYYSYGTLVPVYYHAIQPPTVIPVIAVWIDSVNVFFSRPTYSTTLTMNQDHTIAVAFP